MARSIFVRGCERVFIIFCLRSRGLHYSASSARAVVSEILWVCLCDVREQHDVLRGGMQQVRENFMGRMREACPGRVQHCRR